jgi:hypothetical protein
MRTLGLVMREMELIRAERERHLQAGRLRLAGECCVELDQLTREYAALAVQPRDLDILLSSDRTQVPG